MMKHLLRPLLLLATCGLGAAAQAQHLEPAAIQTMAGEKIGYKMGDQVVIAPKYDEGNAFYRGYATVAIGGRWGAIDSTGREILPLRFRDLNYFSEGLAAASLDGKKYGYVNKSGLFVLPSVYDGAGNFHEGVAVVGRAGKLALITKKGVPITPFKYGSIEPMRGGIARVCLPARGRYELSDYWGCVNRQGVEISKLNGDGSKSPNLGNGFCVSTVHVPGHYDETVSALLDKHGRVVIPASAGYRFEEATSSYLRVRKEFYSGIVDYTGKVLLPATFWRITDFEFGPDKSLAQAYTSDRDFFYVNRQWQCVEFERVTCPKY